MLLSEDDEAEVVLVARGRRAAGRVVSAAHGAIRRE
jgi:hypothetical protein